MFHHSRQLRTVSSAISCDLNRLHSLPAAALLPPKWRRTADILPLCASAQSLSETQRAHALAVVHGHLPRSVSISAALILSYATNHSYPTVLNNLFTRSLPFSRSPFLHNTLIRACTVLSNRHGEHRDTVRSKCIIWYNDLLRSNVPLRPDDHTFPFVLKLCADFLLVEKGLEVHGSSIKAGFDYDVFVSNTLILFYGSWGDLGSVRKVFDQMPRKDLISWNTLIRVFSDNECGLESVSLFKDMFSVFRVSPNAISIVSILPVCACLVDENLVRLVHCYVLKVGLDAEVRVGNALVDAYGKCGDFEAVEGAFNEIGDRNEVSWNSLIGSLAYMGFHSNALGSFRMMVKEGVKSSSITVASMLPVLVQLGLFSKGRELHGFSVRMGINADVFVSNALMDLYGKWSRFAEASNVFCKMSVRNIVSWNTMIGNFAQNGHELEALKHVREMQAHGELPNCVTLTNVLPACARLGSVIHGKEIHARSIRNESVLELFVSNALTDTYAKCYCLDHAQKMFNISLRDEVSYNTLILGYSQTSKCSNSVILFKEMELLGLKQDIISYMGVLSACANLSAIKEGKQIHAFAMRRFFHDHLFVANSLLDLYIKCGRIDISKQVFDQIPKKDTGSWNTMIMGFGMVGDLDSAVSFFEAMKVGNVEYDSVSYIAVLSACSHGGLVEKGKAYFADMLARDITPSDMHYACMVDLLGRSGLLGEAVSLINNLKIKPGVSIWGALLGASRLHGNVVLGCWAAEHLLQLKPEYSGYYVLLSNMYAEAGRWNEADGIRKLMNTRHVKKNPGCSWVQHASLLLSCKELSKYDCGSRICKVQDKHKQGKIRLLEFADEYQVQVLDVRVIEEFQFRNLQTMKELGRKVEPSQDTK
ncbi:pentatricopeptide repeat-containing protein-like [Dorcoceras hygrometricum]|uniref:Pentatricopeptide repeat-containing protein-like n=1 Tax=Dorcoceras hygrometricum TaxID=472368 RepID=A0A2Z7D7T6_9LAMI|nr:pentatricopeptide repeat-containing protein-like [Dorcoceras hygrometricum]